MPRLARLPVQKGAALEEVAIVDLKRQRDEQALLHLATKTGRSWLLRVDLPVSR